MLRRCRELLDPREKRRGLAVDRRCADEPARRDERLQARELGRRGAGTVDRLLGVNARLVTDRGERRRRDEP